MNLDVLELRDFYATLLGRVVSRFVGRAVAQLVRPQPHQRVLGFGFATPYLGPFRRQAERAFAFMPAAQGAMIWPSDGPTLAALVEEDCLPLPDAAVDLILLVHALEASPQPARLMSEARRVLSPAGRLVVVVPNRQGAWARSDVSPFGYGRPYSRGQLRALLADAAFEAESWASALHMPPSARPALLGMAGMLEKAGRAAWPAFAGIICASASKRSGQGLPARTRLVVNPALGPSLRPTGGALPNAPARLSAAST